MALSAKLVSFGFKGATILFLIICIILIVTPQKTTIRTYINGKEASALQTEETIYWDKVSQFKAAFGNSLFALIVAILSVVLLVVRIVLKIDNRIMLIIPLVIVNYFALHAATLCAFWSWYPCQSATNKATGVEIKTEICRSFPKLATAAFFGTFAGLLALGDLLLVALASKF